MKNGLPYRTLDLSQNIITTFLVIDLTAPKKGQKKGHLRQVSPNSKGTLI